jgi:trans-2-enoyl-CoA reductase
MRALDEFSKAEGPISESINGDAFYDAIKGEMIVVIREKFGQIDCMIS